MPYSASMENQAFKRAVDAIGGRQAMAAALGVKPPFVDQVVTGLRPLPLDRCLDVERLTGIECEKLRPDKAAFFIALRRRPAMGSAG